MPQDSLFHYFTRDPDPDCPAPYKSYLLSQWSYKGHEGTSLVQLPGASATLILENVVLSGSPGHADWLTTGVRNGGQGSALAVRRAEGCKGARDIGLGCARPSLGVGLCDTHTNAAAQLSHTDKSAVQVLQRPHQPFGRARLRRGSTLYATGVNWGGGWLTAVSLMTA
jgi:hypothetical protein